MVVSSTLAQRFADYATRLRFEDIPPAAIHEAKRRLIDSFGTAVGAMPSETFSVSRAVRSSREQQARGNAARRR